VTSASTRETIRLGEGAFAVEVAADTPPETVGLIESLLEQIDGLLDRTAQLQVALDSRVVIEQAKGALAERLQMTPENAFEVLRASARRRRVPLHELAQLVVAGASNGAAADVLTE
jgi:AmiR/NasT family two-component response regulator